MQELFIKILDVKIGFDVGLQTVKNGGHMKFRSKAFHGHGEKCKMPCFHKMYDKQVFEKYQCLKSFCLKKEACNLLHFKTKPQNHDVN